MKLSWIRSAFSLFYALFAGSVADKIGFKPVFLCPIAGKIFFESIPHRAGLTLRVYCPMLRTGGKGERIIPEPLILTTAS